MITANLNQIELTEFQSQGDADQRCRATFPIFGALGTRNSAMVYIELDEGKKLGRHTDSAEEVLLVIEGEVEATIGDETGRLRSGEIALVPTMAPHDMRNIGNGRARIVGFFGAQNNVATFDNIWSPTDSNVVDTSRMEQ